MSNAPTSTSLTSPSSRQLLIHRLEAIIAVALEDLANQRPLQLPVRTRLGTQPEGLRRNAFPGRRVEEARTFGVYRLQELLMLCLVGFR